METVVPVTREGTEMVGVGTAQQALSGVFL